jgi:hypothetical protein
VDTCRLNRRGPADRSVLLRRRNRRRSRSARSVPRRRYIDISDAVDEVLYIDEILGSAPPTLAPDVAADSSAVFSRPSYGEATVDAISRDRAAGRATIARAGIFILCVLLLETSIMLYLADQQTFRALNDVISLPANILSWANLAFLSFLLGKFAS